MKVKIKQNNMNTIFKQDSIHAKIKQDKFDLKINSLIRSDEAGFYGFDGSFYGYENKIYGYLTGGKTYV